MKPKLIAQQGRSRFLVQVEEDKGRVLDLEQKKFFAPFNLQSIIARGYWQPYKGEQSKLDKMLLEVDHE